MVICHYFEYKEFYFYWCIVNNEITEMNWCADLARMRDYCRSFKKKGLTLINVTRYISIEDKERIYSKFFHKNSQI